MGWGFCSRTSTQTGVATINSAGLATGVAAGQTQIQCLSGSVTGAATLNVIGITSISVTPANKTIRGIH